MASALNAKWTTVSSAVPITSAQLAPLDTPSSPMSTAPFPSPVNALFVLTPAILVMLTAHAIPASNPTSSQQLTTAASSVMTPDVLHALLLPQEPV